MSQLASFDEFKGSSYITFDGQYVQLRTVMAFLTSVVMGFR